MITMKGMTATEAFVAARDQAAWEYGHRGYTGTIAEKRALVLFREFPEPIAPDDPRGKEQLQARYAVARHALREDDARIADKWGPAGCIPLIQEADGHIEWLFFGNAPG
jgi:hypothetical protein